MAAFNRDRVSRLGKLAIRAEERVVRRRNKRLTKVTFMLEDTSDKKTCYIFAGFNTRLFAGAPFTASYSGEKVFKAREVLLNLDPETEVILLPNIAGHIGGDITAGILATRMEDFK